MGQITSQRNHHRAILLDHARDDRERKQLSAWFDKKYSPAEQPLLTFWIEKLQDLRAIETGVEEKISSSAAREEALEFTTAMRRLWPKYEQVALTEMATALKLRASQAIRLADEAFDDLPASSLQTTDQVKLFSDFISSDLEIEVLRHLKLTEF